MSYECSGCGMQTCDGRCFTQCEADFPPEVETPEVRKPYKPSPEYRAWLQGLIPSPDEIGDPLKHLEPKRRRAA